MREMNQYNYIRKQKTAYEWVKKYSGNEKRHFSPVKNDQPYWTHMMNVHNLVFREFPAEYDLLIACILHDIVEDFDVTFSQIENEFGHKVSHIVKLVTKDNNFSYENADSFYKNIIKNKHASILKVADRIDNLETNTLYRQDNENVLLILNETKKYFFPMCDNHELFTYKKYLMNILHLIES